MKHTPQGTTIEKGDAHHISYYLGNCPACGKEMPNENWRAGGHMKSVFGFNVILAACPEHFEKAHCVAVRMPHKESAGYCGQWEPRFGLVAEIHHSGGPTKHVRLV